MAPGTREDTPTGVSWLDTPTSHGIAASRHSCNNDLVSPGDAKMMYIQSALFAESGNHLFQNDFPHKRVRGQDFKHIPPEKGRDIHLLNYLVPDHH